MTDRQDAPNTIPWPPIILVGTIVVTKSLHALYGLPLPWSVQWLGIALIVAALAVDVTAMITMQRAKTTILPHRGTKNLITHGIFAISRNPIYVANVVIIIGYGLWIGSFWPLIAAPFAALAMQKLAIEREEAHLQANFRAEYDAYRAITRRWL